MLRTRMSTRAILARSALLFTLAIFPAASRMNAQAAATVAEPQYIGEFALLGPEGKLADLEKEKMTMQSKTKNHFISVSATSEQVVPNTSSPVRVPSTAHFIVKTSPSVEGMDPNTLVALKPFVVEKDHRAFPMSAAKAGMFQGVKSQQASDSSIAVKFKKYGQSSLEIIPSQPLPPGEYALSAQGGAMGVYCFGVDPK